MFASWSAGEYGSVGATEWLEVRFACQWMLMSNCAALQMFSLFFRVICLPSVRKFAPTSAWTEWSWVSITHGCRLSVYWNVLNQFLLPPLSSQGRGRFVASASPLLYSLLESTMKEVKAAFLKLDKFCSKRLSSLLTVSVSPPHRCRNRVVIKPCTA